MAEETVETYLCWLSMKFTKNNMRWFRIINCATNDVIFFYVNDWKLHPTYCSYYSIYMKMIRLNIEFFVCLFQQDWAPPHCKPGVNYLDKTLPPCWISCARDDKHVQKRSLLHCAICFLRDIWKAKFLFLRFLRVYMSWNNVSRELWKVAMQICYTWFEMNWRSPWSVPWGAHIEDLWVSKVNFKIYFIKQSKKIHDSFVVTLDV